MYRTGRSIRDHCNANNSLFCWMVFGSTLEAFLGPKVVVLYLILCSDGVLIWQVSMIMGLGLGDGGYVAACQVRYCQTWSGVRTRVYWNFFRPGLSLSRAKAGNSSSDDWQFSFSLSLSLSLSLSTVLFNSSLAVTHWHTLFPRRLASAHAPCPPTKKCQHCSKLPWRLPNLIKNDTANGAASNVYLTSYVHVKNQVHHNEVQNRNHVQPCGLV
jgi:hypothetical protein